MKQQKKRKGSRQPKDRTGTGLSIVQRIEEFLGTPRMRLAVPVAILAATLAISVWTFDEKLSYTGDNTEFIILARSLNQGHGLSLINLPEPKPASKYPFGFPVMLAPMAALFPMNDTTGGTPDWIAMKWLVVALFGGAMVAFFVLASDQWARFPALLATALCLSNPLLVDYGHQVMSEIPYLFFSLLSLVFIERAMRRQDTLHNYWFYAGLAIVMWAYYVRSVGVVLVAAVILYALQQRQYRKAVITGVVAALSALPWWLRNRSVGSGSFYLQQLIWENPYYPDRGIIDLAAYAERLKYNVFGYATREIPGILYAGWRPQEPLAEWIPTWGDVFSTGTAFVVGLSLYAVYLCVRRGQHLLVFNYTILLMGTQIVWPWLSDRFLIPVVPLILFLAVRASADIMERLSAHAPAWVGRAVVTVALVIALRSNAHALTDLEASARETYAYTYRSYYAIGQWLKESTAADAVICCRKPFWMYVVSGRKSVAYPFKDPPEVLASLEANEADFVVVGELSLTTRRHLVPTIQLFPSRFELLFQVESTETFLFRFRKS